MKVVITGSSGFVGQAVAQRLLARGDEIVRAVRRPPHDATEVTWSVEQGFDPPDALSGCDAVIHLAGENVAGGRWTRSRKSLIMDSRTHGTKAVVAALERATPRPKVLVNASAVGFYGDTGAREVDEAADPGTGFLAEVTQAWEQAAQAAEALGVRVVRLRFGVVLGAGGGALARMLPAFKVGAGGRLGSGDQYMSWVHLDDAVGATVLAVDAAEMAGAYNVTAPNPVTNADFTKALGTAIHRPTVFPVPRFALRTLFGEMGEAVLLEGQRVAPKRLQEAGFEFRYPQLHQALAHAVG